MLVIEMLATMTSEQRFGFIAGTLDGHHELIKQQGALIAALLEQVSEIAALRMDRDAQAERIAELEAQTVALGCYQDIQAAIQQEQMTILAEALAKHERVHKNWEFEGF